MNDMTMLLILTSIAIGYGVLTVIVLLNMIRELKREINRIKDRKSGGRG